MRLERFYYFVKIADLHSFSAASAELFVSQQALSTSIKNLEEDFNTQLFIRSPKGVVLSEDGKYFYDQATKILALYEQLYDHFYIRSPHSETLTIALNAMIKAWYFSDIISYFLKNYPSAHIDYVLTENKDIINSVVQQKATLGVLPVIKIDKQLQIDFPSTISFMPLVDTHYTLLTSIHSPLAGFKSVSMSTIVKYPIILHSSSETDLFSQLVQFYSDDADIRTTDSDNLQMSMVENNLGHMFFLQSDPIPSNQFCKIPITNDLSICIGFLYRNDVPLTAFQELYIEKAKNFIVRSQKLFL